VNSKKQFAALLSTSLAAMLLISGTGTVHSHSSAAATMSATMGGTMAATMAAADQPYCTPAIAALNAPKNYFIPMISKGFQHQFWQAVKKGAYQAAQDCGVAITFEGPETEAMVDKQIEMLTTALAKNPAAIGFAALDTKAAIPLLQQAQAAHIPVIGFDSGVDSDIVATTAATDNTKAAGVLADKMAAMIGGSGEVALVVHDQTSQTGVSRRDGFVAEMKAKYPNIKIVDIQYGAGDQLKSTDITKAIIQAHPNLKGIFGANEGSVIGVINGVTELNMQGKIVIMGYDSGKQQLDAIRSGVEAGAITQNPVGIGYKAVEAAVKALNGVAIPKTIDTGFYWYDKTNIDDPTIVADLYQ